MATESNLGRIYTAGLGNVGSYQVAGTPYLSASLIEEQEKEFSFAHVTKRIIVENTGSNDIYLYFVSSVQTKLKLPATKKIDMDVKCTSLYVSGSTQSGVQIAAELTGIPAIRMYSLVGLEGM
ncbi:MAG: hypothetical protein CMC14_05125 [Flavobacteriaceae bacterium]|nr:hypothetical protein [Flavobacteriaceae bacterium]